ncbi:MAG: hypothetical protein R3E58_09110 [Phycisphaerae bacterium]|nr:hypothetical protein [Phycisphaerales bacterium]
MRQPISVLQRVRVASPCHESWADMSGDERVRHCDRCDLNVYNLSEMNRTEAEELIRNNEGRLCVRFYARADGTMITRDCPVGRGLVRRRLRWIAACIVGAFSALIGTAFAISNGGGSRRTAELRGLKAFAPICDRLSPRLVPGPIMGSMVVPANWNQIVNGSNNSSGSQATQSSAETSGDHPDRVRTSSDHGAE